jgi:hypothetical protein
MQPVFTEKMLTWHAYFSYELFLSELKAACVHGKDADLARMIVL